MTHTFTFDARFCSGCKACQAACKDKNHLPVGVLWRRVYEVTGGSWQQEGDAWTNNVFAYNLSIACNHCLHPKCAGVCPTNAYVVREDGIVVLDTTKCVGCGYCAWACPYSVPQYNAEAGHMTKCDFCFDNLEQGLPPACVAACPLRVLDHKEMECVTEDVALWETPPTEHPYPLPGFSHTQPRVAIQLHPGMKRSETKSVANAEEIQPRKTSSWDELPLMIFTLLAQLAVGGFWAMALMFPLSGLRLLPSLLIGVSLGVGMLASFAHLGTKKNAWRVLSNVGKSSLSKEILFASLFGFSWLLTTLDSLIWRRNATEWTAVTSILGLGLIYNMSQVYRFRAAPGWNTWRTNASFMISAILLGTSAMMPMLVYETSKTGIPAASNLWSLVNGSIVLLVVAQLLLTQKHTDHKQLHMVRVALMIAVLLAVLVNIFQDYLFSNAISLIIFVFVMLEETMGRWLFYQSRLTKS